FSSRRRHTRSKRDWSSDVCSSDLGKRNGLDIRLFRQLLHTVAGQAVLIIGKAFAFFHGFGRADEQLTAGRAFCGQIAGLYIHGRSEERRVGKECRSGTAAKW